MLADAIIDVKVDNLVIRAVRLELHPIREAFEDDRLIDVRIAVNQLAKRRSDSPRDMCIGILVSDVATDRFAGYDIPDVLDKTDKNSHINRQSSYPGRLRNRHGREGRMADALQTAQKPSRSVSRPRRPGSLTRYASLRNPRCSCTRFAVPTPESLPKAPTDRWPVNLILE